MKKTILSVMLSALVAFTSCGTADEGATTTPGDQVTATFDVQTPVKTRITGLTRYIVEAYENNDLTSTPLRKESAMGNLTLTLKKNTDYTFLFWADNGTAATESVPSSGYYNTASLKAVAVTANQLNNIGQRAYSLKTSFNSNNFEANKLIVLKNAVAEVNLYESAGFENDNNTLKLTYTTNTTFNVGTGVATNVAMEVTRTFSGLGKIAKNALFVTDYVLAPLGDKSIGTIKVVLNNEARKSISNVPLQCGYKTNITGEYSNLYGASFAIGNEIDTWGATTDVNLVNPPTKTVNINGVDFKFILVKGGTFQMGSPLNTPIARPEENPHWVRLTSDYYIGETEITQAQWKAVMGTNPSSFQTPIAPDLNTDNYPVEMVSWLDICGGTAEGSTVNPADCFLTKINALNKGVFNLPTEAQREYAARGGHKATSYMIFPMLTPTTDYAVDESKMDNFAWGFVDPNTTTHPVRMKTPNLLGLYDMSGNVSEWCLDLLNKVAYVIEEYYIPVGNSESQPKIDPIDKRGSMGAHRGFGINGPASSGRNSMRSCSVLNSRNKSTGLRLVLVP